MNAPIFTGAVLAGGASRRMGQDKAQLVLDTEPLWQRQVRVLREAGAARVGVVRRADQAPLPLNASTELWLDIATGIGPLAGLHAALGACQSDWLAVVATDMPHLDAKWFQWLLSFCQRGVGAMARHESGFFEPLAAIYPRTAFAEVERRAVHGPHALQALAHHLQAQQQLHVVPLPANESGRVVSWNTPAAPR